MILLHNINSLIASFNIDHKVPVPYFIADCQSNMAKYFIGITSGVRISLVYYPTVKIVCCRNYAENNDWQFKEEEVVKGID